MDIGFRTSSGNFSLRSAGLVIHDNRLLVARNDEFDCFYIVGGEIHEDESSAKAVVRELYEETGYRYEINRLIFIQERFYKVGNICHHEVVFFYLMKEADIKLQNGINTDQLNEKMYLN